MISKLYYQLFLILGLVVSFEDWSERKIRNQWIGLGLLICGGGLLWLLLSSALGHRQLRVLGAGEYYLPWRFFPQLLAHLFLSLTAGYAMWRLNVWPAGDAKLYLVFAFFIALIDPNIPGFPLLLFMILLINVFVPAGILFAAETVFRVVPRVSDFRGIEWGRKLKALAETAWVRIKDGWPFRYEYAALVVNLFALFFGMVVLGSKVRSLALGPFGQLLVYLFLLLVWSWAIKLLRMKRIGFVSLLALSAVTVAGTVQRHWDVWGWIISAARMTFNFGLFISFARVLFDWFIEWDSRRELDPENLKPGTILSDETWGRLQNVKELEGKLGARYCDGLSAGDVEVLKAWLAQGGTQGAAQGGVLAVAQGGAPAAAPDLAAGPQPGKLTVYHTIPFAVWIFMGALLTLSRRGTVLHVIVPWLGRVKAVLKATAAGLLS